MYISLTKWEKLVPESPGWLSVAELLDLLEQNPEMEGQEIITNYINAFMTVFTQISAMPGAIEYMRTDDVGQNIQYTAVAANSLPNLIGIKSVTTDNAEFIECRDALLEFLNTEMTTYPPFMVDEEFKLTRESVSSLIND